MMRAGAFIAWIAGVVLIAAPAAAQQARPSLNDSIPPPGALVSVYGRISMETLRFLTPPRGSIRFTGSASDTLRVSISNLSHPVRTDTIYKDVQVYFHYSTGLANIDSLIQAISRGRRGAPDP